MKRFFPLFGLSLCCLCATLASQAQPVAAPPPTVTVSGVPKLDPLMVMLVSPLFGPVEGLQLPMVGGGL